MSLRQPGQDARNWERELRPRVLEINAELEGMRPDRVPAEEAAPLLNRLWELVQEEWVIHFLVVLPALTAAEHAAPEQLLGIDNPADDAVWELADVARREAVDDLIRDFAPAAALDRLHSSAPGRRFLRDLGLYLERYGGRARWHELSLPREAEQPTMKLEAVRLAIELGEPARSPAPDDADDPLRAGYALKELHTYDIDYPSLGAAGHPHPRDHRRELLRLGRQCISGIRRVTRRRRGGRPRRVRPGRPCPY
jgi:hypothetical protein